MMKKSRRRKIRKMMRRIEEKKENGQKKGKNILTIYEEMRIILILTKSISIAAERKAIIGRI